MADLGAAFGEQRFGVAVGEAKAQVPADRQHDHIGREAEPRERRAGRWVQGRGGGSSWQQSACSGRSNSGNSARRRPHPPDHGHGRGRGPLAPGHYLAGLDLPQGHPSPADHPPDPVPAQPVLAQRDRVRGHQPHAAQAHPATWPITDAAAAASRRCTTSATPLPRMPPDRHRRHPQGHSQPSQPRHRHPARPRTLQHRRRPAPQRRDATRPVPSLQHRLVTDTPAGCRGPAAIPEGLRKVRY
jgi:hypothetical protein